VIVDSANATDSAVFSPSTEPGLLGSNPCSPLNHPDLASGIEVEIDRNQLHLVVSPVRRARGRPRRQATNVPLKGPALESIRRLRSRKNTTKATSQDPWTILSNAPALTPLSPKKNRQVRALQRPPQPPVS
jgi:hypothetical protein